MEHLKGRGDGEIKIKVYFNTFVFSRENRCVPLKNVAFTWKTT